MILMAILMRITVHVSVLEELKAALLMSPGCLGVSPEEGKSEVSQQGPVHRWNTALAASYPAVVCPLVPKSPSRREEQVDLASADNAIFSHSSTRTKVLIKE